MIVAPVGQEVKEYKPSKVVERDQIPSWFIISTVLAPSAAVG
jgi:hypothetical protein